MAVVVALTIVVTLTVLVALRRVVLMRALPMVILMRVVEGVPVVQDRGGQVLLMHAGNLRRQHGRKLRRDTANIVRERIVVKNMRSPDAAWTFLDESERVAVELGDMAIGRGVYQPGWRWSEHARPLSGKDSAEHFGYVISGRMHVQASDGTEAEIEPGDAFLVAPGHDAWVVGDEPCVALDFIKM
jgi:quercetin dioxygenase-like cupin family protein